MFEQGVQRIKMNRWSAFGHFMDVYIHNPHGLTNIDDKSVRWIDGFRILTLKNERMGMKSQACSDV